jgi:hypothetical protein
MLLIAAVSLSLIVDVIGLSNALIPVGHDGGSAEVSVRSGPIQAARGSAIHLESRTAGTSEAAAPPSASQGQDSWTRVELDSPRIASLAGDPLDPSRVYAVGLTGSCRASPPTGTNVFTSGDGGSTWTSQRLGTCNVGQGVAVDGRGAVYAAIFPNALYRSDDGGQSWMRTLPYSGGVVLPAIHPLQPEILFVEALSRLMTSTDGGASWSDVDVPGARGCSLRPVVFAPSNPDRVFLGGGCSLYRSDDGGVTWGVLPEAPRVVHDIAVSPTDPNMLLAIGAVTVERLSTLVQQP